MVPDHVEVTALFHAPPSSMKPENFRGIQTTDRSLACLGRIYFIEEFTRRVRKVYKAY